MSLQLSINQSERPRPDGRALAPDGTTVQLFSGVATTGSSPARELHEHHLRRAATTPIQLAATIPVTGIGAGPFNPQFPLSTFKTTVRWATGRCKPQQLVHPQRHAGQLELDAQELPCPAPGWGSRSTTSSPARSAIFTQDPTNPVAQQSWTAVGVSFAQRRRGSGRIRRLAWTPRIRRATPFTWPRQRQRLEDHQLPDSSANGPTYLPLTALGPATSEHRQHRRLRPQQRPQPVDHLCLHGEGDTFTPGVGFLRSMDGGRSWRLLDSTVNVDASGNVLAINDRPATTCSPT